ncbi:MAG: tRNA (N6-isopentenyl adenosine(37)-C2)-methylthiotransferase MiaB [Thermodesulfobacteriota bacterium]
MITMGCQMNEYDSDLVSQALLRSGYIPAGDGDEADLVLVNTCTVRAKAEQKAYSLLGRLLREKQKRPDLNLVLMGCIAQQEGGDLLKRFPGLDLVLGTREVGGIGEYVESLERGRRGLVAIRDRIPPPCPSNTPGFFKGRIKAHLSIMEGCNNFCTYCVVPYVRGREVSRPFLDVVKEAGHLVDEGVREITLLGQNVNSYCDAQEGGLRFPSLLRSLSGLKGLWRLRFTTSHPKDLSDDLIRCFGELSNLCPHIHLPFQSGSNRILARMNRGYTREKYMERAMKLREVCPQIAITSDVMVGFPGETEEDFGLTLDLMERIQFDNLYSFKYSDRKGARAAKMSGKIEDKEKALRLSVLQGMQKQIAAQKNKSLEGRELEVLVEGISRRGNQQSGRTPTNKIVNFTSNKDMLGTLVQVLIKRSSANSLWGECGKSARRG